MPRRPLVLVHGYAASAPAFDAWRAILHRNGYGDDDLHVVEYTSLTNEVVLEDLAEGFERAIRLEPGLGAETRFDAMVHSTGMLVLRAWLAARPERAARLGTLIGLAPATFGSPLAHKGRGMLGAVFRGNREIGPDFMEAGDRILDALELGSAVTWDLAERDLVGDATAFSARDAGPNRTGPRAFLFCGVEGYPFPRSLVNSPGSDGTVRLAGAAMNVRLFTLDLTRAARGTKRARVRDGSQVGPFAVAIEGCDHETILHRPTERLQELVLSALAIPNPEKPAEPPGPASEGAATGPSAPLSAVDDPRGEAQSHAAWLEAAREHNRALFARRGDLRPWQQVVFRVRDERGASVPDYFIEFLSKRREDGPWEAVHEIAPAFTYDVHVYSTDPSYRCFHIDLASADLRGKPVGLRLLAASGTDRVGYQGYRQELEVTSAIADHAEWDGVIDLSDVRRDVPLFCPHTTTLVDIRLDREPLPLRGYNKLVRFPHEGRGDAPHPLFED